MRFYTYILLIILFADHLFAQNDTTITLKAITGLQYDLPRIAVKPNQRLTIVFKNEDDMAHNLVFTQPNARQEIVDAAMKIGDKAQEQHYVPKSTQLLAATKIVLPNASETLQFVAPEKEGICNYVCTYPGHGAIMYGAMYVTNKPLPPLSSDPNIPPNRQAEATHHHAVPSPHPFELEYPLIYRTFMPDCGPAAIAVALSPTHSFCFDAGKCQLRYVWTGGFIDNTDHWKGNGNALAKILGTIYFRDSTDFPFRFSIDTRPEVSFKGYQLIKRTPRFMYLMDKILVTELITALPNEAGIVRSFTFPIPLPKDIFFVSKATDGILYESSSGKWENGVLRIPKGTKNFRLTMKKK